MTVICVMFAGCMMFHRMCQWAYAGISGSVCVWVCVCVCEFVGGNERVCSWLSAAI
jgi:hypothetical protein